LIRYHASWVLPIAGPPIRDGWVSVDEGRIVAVGRQSAVEAADRAIESGGARDLGRVVVMPGLVNAHIHLELSYLRGQVPPAANFVSWIRTVMAARRERPDPSGAEIVDALQNGIAEAVRCGTALVGDISNTLITFDPLTRSDLAAVVFFELIGFNVEDPRQFVEEAARRLEALASSDTVRTSLAAHAPYSVAPLVLRAIREAVNRDPLAPCSVHLAESAEELEFMASGGGAWRALLEDLGSWDPLWEPPGGSPVEYLDDLDFLDRRVLAVHGVQMTAVDLERLSAHGTTLVACPRSNRYTGAGVPPIEAFYGAGVPVAVGTDSLASTPDLSLFAELAAMRAIAPSVPAAALLDSATRVGARALGFHADYGTIEPGRRARLLAVSLPDAVDDVEEYLVSGIVPEQVRWVEG
jgi:cytosine/adenosine deaminase-related metal-dependent hydrolase